MVDEFLSFTKETKFVINEDKCEAMLINFSRKMSFSPSITIGGTDTIKEVYHTKLLGVIIQSDLRWDLNTDYIFSKASSKLWLLRRLKFLNIEPLILTDFYVKEIRSVLEYAAPVWYSSITSEQSRQLEKIQVYSVSIILSDWDSSYKHKCARLKLEPLYLRRRKIALNYGLRTAANVEYRDYFFKKKMHCYNTRAQGLFYEQMKSNSRRHYLSPLVSITRDLNEYMKNKTKGV